MKMVIVLAVCLALSAASASAQIMPPFYASALQMPWMGMGMQGISPMMTMMGAEYLRQPQCSPVAAPFYAQTMWQPNFISHPLRQQCCQQMRTMDMQSWPGFVQQLQMMMQLQGTTAVSSLYLQPALMQQLQQLLPVAQDLTPMAMAVAQVAQNMPAMCGPYQLPNYCTTACAAIPPYYY